MNESKTERGGRKKVSDSVHLKQPKKGRQNHQRSVVVVLERDRDRESHTHNKLTT
jgi:hypothetical protein